MHANKGSRKPQSPGPSSSKSTPKTMAEGSDQKLDNGKNSIKKTGRTKNDIGSSHRSSIHVKRVLTGKIGRRSLNGFVNKSVRNSGQRRLGHRPRRNVIHRTWDYTAGLSWKEEKELKKALMASLQESKKSNKPSTEHNSESSNGNPEVTQNKGNRKQKTLKLEIPEPQETGNQTESSTKTVNLNYHVQVRAQRKFAQGSRPCSPGCSPLKGRNLHSKALVTKKAKTEDFLTFLCLRGSTTLPPHLDFSNNFMDCDSLSSFPNTPRHSQDGSRPDTPVTANTNHGTNGRGSDDTSRSGSPDVEITLESADLGVKPLVGASGRAAVVSGGVGSATSARASTFLTNRCATATRCTTNAMSFSDSNSSFSTSTATSSSASTPSPVDSSMEGTAGVGLHGTDYTSVSASTEPEYQVEVEESAAVMHGISKHYATRGKQKTVQEMIAAKEHRSSMLTKRALKACAGGIYPGKCKVQHKGDKQAKTVAKKSIMKTRDSTETSKSQERSKTHKECLGEKSKCYTFHDEVNYNIQKKCCRITEKGKAPTIKRSFKGSRQLGMSKSFITELPSIGDEDCLPENTNAANTRNEPQPSDDDISESVNFKVEIATQTSDTSSYTAEIDAECLLDDNSDTDFSEEEVSSDDKQDIDDGTVAEETSVQTRTVTTKQDYETRHEEDSSQNVDTYTTVSYQDAPSGGQEMVTMEASTTISEPVVSFTSCPITAIPPFSQPAPLPVSYTEPVSTSASLAQTAVIAYSGNTFPLQTCTMMGQNLILDDNGRSMLLGDASNQVVNNVSIQMQGFSVQHGLSTLPLDNISGLSYMHPALNVGTGPSHSLLPNTIATIDNSMATPPVAIMHNPSIAFQGGQSLQPLETPENSPVKSDPVVQVEPDTTVVDERSSDQSHDVILLGSTTEPSTCDQDHKKQPSLSKLRQNKSKSPEKQPFKRRLSKGGNSLSLSRSPSPNKKSPKKQSESEAHRNLRCESKKNDSENLVDLTEVDEQVKRTPQKKLKCKQDEKLKNKRSLSPVGVEEKEQRTNISPKRRLRTDTTLKMGRKVKDSPERNRLTSGKKHSTGSQDELRDCGISKRGHLRSSSHNSPSARLTSSPKLASTKKDLDTDVMTRSKTGTVPKAAVPAGFPGPDDPARLTEVPTYHPSAEQFQDPIAYLDSIWRDAEPYGMCRIVPPEGWKPECDISEELRFTTQVQYIHKMADRWGPSVKQFECIKQHLKSQGINMEQSPCVGGVELDLPSVSAAIRSQGGLQSVLNKNKWQKVAENMRIPKAGQERISRLYEIYCKYLLSYDTLSEEEKERLEQEVENKYTKGSRHLDQSCTSKGRSKPLSEFFRVARNTQSMWFNDDEPTADQVENLYWQLVSERDQHVSIQVAHIDTKHCGSAFPAKKDSPYARHGWNYNILQHHPSSVLRHLGQVTGLTVPMLHIGMVFSTSCWARDPHFLPYMVYSHTGADVIWYCVPKSEEAKFKQALKEVAPKLIDAQSPIWLPEDSVMVDPKILLEHDVSYCRTVQYQGEFVVVFPKAFTATVTCGYNISESLHFATAKWLPLGCEAAQLLYASGEPDLFSMEKLLYLLATDEKTPIETLQILLPLLEKIIEEELDLRKRLGEAGLQQAKKVSRNELFLTSQERPRRSVDLTSHEENRCDSSCKICYLSTVVNEAENLLFALPDALLHIRRKKNLRNCKLLYRFEKKELKDLIQQVKSRIAMGRTSSKRKSSKNR